MFNFNLKKGEYKLYGSVTRELINLYGFPITWVKTKLLGHDIVLNDIQNYGTDKVVQVMVYPLNPEAFNEHMDSLFNKFGLFSIDSMDLCISKTDVLKICDESSIPSLVGDIIILESGKYLEVTGIESQVIGANNQFVKNFDKNVYQVHCKSYNYNYDELPTQSSLGQTDPGIDDKNLEQIFGILGADVGEKTSSGKETYETIRKKQQDSPLVKGKDAIFGYLDS